MKNFEFRISNEEESDHVAIRNSSFELQNSKFTASNPATASVWSSYGGSRVDEEC